MSRKVTILGAGAFGTALGKFLTGNKCDVALWAHSEKTANDINNLHKTDKLKHEGKNVVLPQTLKAYTDIEFVLNHSELIISTIISSGLRDFLEKSKEFWAKDFHLLSTTKGLEENSGKRMTELYADILGINESNIAVLSGPNLAIDIAIGRPVVSVIASKSNDTLNIFENLFTTDDYIFRLSKTDDVVGVELNGAIKNALAIVAGIYYGMGLGESMRAGISALGMREIRMLCDLMGGNPITSADIAGYGDASLTCTSEDSRNHKFGEKIGRNPKSIANVMNEKRASIVEGLNTIVAIILC